MPVVHVIVAALAPLPLVTQGVHALPSNQKPASQVVATWLVPVVHVTVAALAPLPFVAQGVHALPSNQKPASQVVATWLVPVVHVTVAALAPLPLVPQLLQLVSSFSEAEPYCPPGHTLHDFALSNGFNSGLDMYAPASQHPKRPVDVK